MTIQPIQHKWFEVKKWLFWRDEIKVPTSVSVFQCVYLKSYYRASQKDLLHVLNLPTHLSDPILQSLAYSIDVLTPLGSSFTRDEAL